MEFDTCWIHFASFHIEAESMCAAAGHPLGTVLHHFLFSSREFVGALYTVFVGLTLFKKN